MTMISSASHARSTLVRACRVLARHEPRLTHTRVRVGGEGLVVDLEIAGRAITLDVRPRDDRPTWKRTASLSLAIQSDTPIDQLPRDVEQVLAVLATLIDRTDAGDLVLPAASVASSPDPTGFVGRHGPTARAAHERLADELHFAAFVAVKATTTEDLYPHVGPLGVPVPRAEILAGWRDTARRIDDGRAPRKLGLYVHIPFCTVACTFCYCGKTDGFTRAGFATYLDRMQAEIDETAPLLAGRTFTSVYFGGGTPSLLTPPAMEALFTALWRAYDVPAGTQVIFEGNPDSLSERKIELLGSVGRATRLTIGVQTLDPDAQRAARRHNKPEQVADAVRWGRAAGIPHVNIDLMAGLDGQSFEAFQDDVRFVLSLEPDSLHLNGFRPLPRTRWAGAGGDLSAERVRLRDAMLEWGHAAIAEAGFSSQQHQEAHRTHDASNLQEYDLRRQNSSLLGLGFPSRAHSFANHYYAPDTSAGFDRALAAWLAGDARWRAVRVDEHEERHKFLVNNLRTGFERATFVDLFGVDAVDVAPDALRTLEQLGVVQIDSDRVHTDAGTAAECLTYRWLLYSDKVRDRVRRVWGAEYDRGRDWVAELDRLVEAPGASEIEREAAAPA